MFGRRNSVLLFGCLLLCLPPSHGFYPDDQKPRLLVKNISEVEGVASFTGRKTESDIRGILDVQEVRFAYGSLLLGTRNAVYVISRDSLIRSSGDILYDQILWWFGQNDTNCEQKKSKITCQNYIRVVAPTSPNNILLCGTNAAFPKCMEYAWEMNRINERKYNNSPRGLVHFLPHDDLSSLAYRVAGGEIYIATRTDINGNDPAISKSTVSHESKTNLRTDKSALNNADFVKIMETTDKMLIFFREIADEDSVRYEKNVYSRVAQVCKGDRGGNRLLTQKWTSFFKARLNCSIPGDRPFYFNEIQGVTDPVNVGGEQVVFATMTTPANSIAGSAVCAFTLPEIQRVFQGGFWEQNQKSFCWNKLRNAPSPHPTSCSNKAITNSTVLKFIKRHPIMSQSVGSLGNRPVFMTTQTRSRFTFINVETVQTLKAKITILYIGTDDGKLLKVSSSNFPEHTVLSEEWNVFEEQSCSFPSTSVSGRSGASIDTRTRTNDDVKRVNKIIFVPKSEYLLVIFRHCVMRVPKEACFLHKCERSCRTSGNPFCSWTNEACRPVSRDTVSNTVVDLSSGREPCPLNDSQNANASQFTQEEQCYQPSNLALVLVVGLLSTFSVLLLIFLILIICRGRKQQSRRRSSCISEKPSTLAVANQSAIKEDGRRFSRTKRNQAPRVSIEPSSHPTANEDLLTSSGGATTPEVGGIHVVPNLLNEGINSGEDTTWSDDWLGSDMASPTGNSDRHVAVPVVEQVQCNSNNNRAVGVAYPMNQRLGKLSQVVPPTFVSKQPKIKLGSQKDYGSLLQTNSRDQRDDVTVHSRIVTNPNYLPVSPYTPRTPADAKPRVESVGSPMTATFKTFSSPPEERSNSVDSIFPPPPPCVLSPASQGTEGATTLPVSTSWYPSPPGEDELNPNSPPPSAYPVFITPEVILNEKTPLNDSSKQFTSSSKAMSSSASGDSSTSGFVSSSPKSSFKDKTSSSRKGLIVAKGILSAQTYAPLKKKNKKKKDAKSRIVEKYSVAERQDAASENNWSTQVDVGEDSFEEDSSEDSNGIPQISPEFVVSSEEEAVHQFSPHQEDASTPKAEDPKSKSKKPINLFKGRRSKKWKKDRHQGIRITDEDKFMSPAYDEEPFVPTVVGWEEIEYTSPAGVLGEGMTSFQADQSFNERRAYDDSYVEMRGGTGPAQDCAFYTLRPKGRRRRMPKMRNTDKEWATTNNPLPVPTPAVPDAI